MRYLGWLASLFIYFFCSWNPDTFFFQSLAPKSLFVVLEDQKKSDFSQVLSQLEELKKQTPRGKRPEGLKEKMALLSQKTPVNREEYLQGRKMFGWWLFYYDWFKLYNNELSEAFLSVKSKQLEENYFLRFSSEILNFSLKTEPTWDLKRIREIWDTAIKNKDMNTINIWEKVLSSRKTIEEWLMSEGVLTKSLHLVHGLSAEELKRAIEVKEKIRVELSPEAKGGFKYVIQVKVWLNEKDEPDYSFALDGYHSSVANMNREINTLNLSYRPYRVPVLGEVNITAQLWLEEFIFGKHPISFIQWYAKDEYGKNRFSSDEVAAMWKEIQLRAATQFLLHYVQDLAMTTSIMDPYNGNIKLTWTESQEKQIDLGEVKIFDIGDLDTTTQFKPVIVDVGSLDPVAGEVWFYFKFIYNYYYKSLSKTVKEKLPEVPFLEVTRIEFLNLFLDKKELTEEEQLFFVASLMKYLKEDMKLVQSKEDEASRKFYNDLENDLVLKAEEQIKETGSWDYILALAKKENSQKLFDKANELLKKLAQSASSLPLRQKANDIYLERTGQKAAELPDFKSPRREFEIAI